MATSAPGLPVEVQTLKAKGHALTIAFLAKYTNDESILEIDTSKAPWKIISAKLNGAAIDVAPLEMKLREQDGARQPATAPDSKSEGREKTKPESKRRSP